MKNRFLDWQEIKPGQVWKPCDGSLSFVEVVAINEREVWYRTLDGKVRDRDPFSFQVRYALAGE